MKSRLAILKNQNTINCILIAMWFITVMVLFCIMAEYLRGISDIAAHYVAGFKISSHYFE
jgi:hypothetical protein